jgi:predicted dehydrogenase
VEPAAAGREWAAAHLGLAPECIFAELEPALEQVDAEAVLVVTPPETHLAVAAAALRAGKHVLTEKPLTPTLPEARQAIAAAESAGRIMMVSQNYRFRGQARLARAAVATGMIGDLVSVSVECERDLRKAYPADNFRYAMRHPYVLDMAIHHADLIRALTGRNVTSVKAVSWRVPECPYVYDPAAAALLTLDSGVPVVYRGSVGSDRPWTSWNGDWELVGERGRLTWNGGVDDPNQGQITVDLWGQAPKPMPVPRSMAIDREAVLDAFAHAVETGEEPETSVRDNILSLAIVIGMVESIDRGEEVRIADLLAI